jgi:hypothetical protein
LDILGKAAFGVAFVEARLNPVLEGIKFSA